MFAFWAHRDPLVGSCLVRFELNMQQNSLVQLGWLLNLHPCFPHCGCVVGFIVLSGLWHFLGKRGSAMQEL